MGLRFTKSLLILKKMKFFSIQEISISLRMYQRRMGRPVFI
jgi:hypothetical protein